jgi:hypothetical protein
MHLEGETESGKIIVDTEGMIDSGAGGKFIDQNFARNKKLPLQLLPTPLKVYNVDGTLNKQGTIRYSTTMNVTIHGHTRPITFYITGLGKQKVIMGFPWLEEANPIIDWRKGTLEWRQSPSSTPPIRPTKPYCREQPV